MSSKYLSVSLAAVVVALLVYPPKASAQSDQCVTLAWSPSLSPGVAGYVVHYGTASGVYPYRLDVGNQTTAVISNLQSGLTYCFVVTAYNVLGMNSDPSNEVSYQVPSAPPALPPVITLTSPVAGACYTAPASITLAAGVVANGHTASKVQFYSGATLLGEAVAGPYVFNWNALTAGNHSILARLTYDSGSVIDSSPVSITVEPALIPWQVAALGSAGLLGSHTSTNGILTLTGAGTLGGTADNLRFVYQNLSADGQIVAQIQSVGRTGSSARVGVMIRETLAGNSRCVFLGVSPDGKFRWQRRINTGGKMTASTPGSGVPPKVWVRLVRTGNTVYGYRSADGISWTAVGSQNLTMAANIYCGLVVASGRASTLNTSTFANVSVVP